MPVEAAQNWLSTHDQLIPALDDLHDRVIELLNEGVASLSEIADVIMLDPGMSVLLLKQVNSKLKKSNRAGVETVHTAMSHLGKSAITTLLAQHGKFSEVCTDKSAQSIYHQLLSQGYHALAQLETFARMQGISTIDDMRAAILLYNLGELYACLFDIDKYRQYRNRIKATTEDNHSEAHIFGFDFIQLGKLIAQKWMLPELLLESFESNKSIGRKSRLVQLAAEIARQAEVGWYHPAMTTAQKNCADYLNLSAAEACSSVQQTAIHAARESSLDDVFNAAARLILLPDLEPVAIHEPESPPTVTSKTTIQAPLSARIKALLQKADASQSAILNLLLSGLQRQLGFSQVVLMLLSADKSKLAMRLGKGLETNSAFNRLQLEVAQSGLIKSLLQKPQALCINPGNYKKYEAMLPGKFKATCLCDNFTMMSIFIGNKPIGLVYCDRQQLEGEIDSSSYQEFKSSVMMASQALTYLVKSKSRASA